MSRGTIKWDSVETWERIIASIMATGVKIDLKAAAAFYGTTYDTLENRLRKTKKLAKELEAAAGGNPTATVKPSTPRKPKTPNNSPLNKVANGRVVKTTPTKRTPKKKNIELECDDNEQQLGYGNFALDALTSEDDAHGELQDPIADDFAFGFAM